LRRFPLTYEGVRSALSSPRTWPDLAPSQLARLTELAIFIYGRTGERELLDSMPDFYPHFAERVRVGERREVFARLSTYAREQEVRRDALYPFLLCEDDPEIVSQAAHDLALYHQPTAADLPDGPEHVLGLVLNGGLINPGAALAGLLQLGDPDVCARIATLRPILATRELNHTLLQLVTCADAPVHLATVLFYVDWLESLDRDDKSHAFGHVASALVILRRNAGEVVIDGRRRFPVPNDSSSPYLPGMRVLDIREVTRMIVPRLEALAANEPAPRIVPRVLEAWLVTES
jgi:hypothetical protein